MNSADGQKALRVNPLKWNVLTWLVFLPWLAFGVFTNLPEVGRNVSGVVTSFHAGWPFPHTELLYPAGSVSATRQDTSIVIAIIDLLLIALVQFSIVAIAPRWPRNFSLRALLLLVTLVAILIVIGRKAFVAEQYSIIVAGIYIVYFSPTATWLGVIVMSKFGFTHFTEKHLAVAVAVALIGLGVSSVWEYIPGTYNRDESGFPHGTGKATHYYDSGALELEEWYLAGVVTKATWYRPDGTHVRTSVFDKESGGVWLYLREDGSIKSRMRFRYSPSDRMYIAHGTATYYAPDGTVEKSVEY